ncbi:competence protein CoiA family protein [Psychrobacillus sp. FSL K6-2836]|uniref:competence protein CoiA n=1 Tax=Psychrobacillus sp. FSL K6-2836 TaxID=2921548 RepID=UPI0030FD1D94
MQKAILRGETINLIEKRWKNRREYLKQPLQRNELFCPLCESKVEMHWALPAKRISHFKHKIQRDCTYGVGESEEHNLGKLKLYEYLKETLASKLETIQVEHFLPDSKQVADIFILFKTGQKWVVEYQRSNISSEDIRKRRLLYKSLNITDIWICGENLVKEDELVTVSLRNAAQELQYKGKFGSASLITFNPIKEEISIFRGLERLNLNSFTISDIFKCQLNELCFNVWGILIVIRII